MRRVVHGLIWVAAAVLLVAVGVVAGRWTVAPQAEEPQVGPELYTVVEGSVGQSVNLLAQGSWERSEGPPAGVGGVLTELFVEAGQEVLAGDEVFSVDLRPVVVLVGEVPAFRDLERDVRGPDVRQLQEHLAGLGYAVATDGVFGASTERAVQAWQDDLGISDDGVARQGDVMFVPDLPVRVDLAEGVGVGSEIAPGERVLVLLGAEPEFEVAADRGSEGPALEDLEEVRIQTGQAEGWQAEVGAVGQDDDGTATAELHGVDGDSICGEQCDQVSLRQEVTRFPAVAQLGADTEGPMVPLGAITTDAGGEATVQTVEGEQVSIEVLASDGGNAVVDGIEVGDVLSLPEGPE